MQAYTWEAIKDAVLLCAPQNSIEDPNMRPTGARKRPTNSQRTFCVLEEYGLLDDTYGILGRRRGDRGNNFLE
eukprot:12925198-Prorocentrum_lima.AAC.1